MKQPESPSFGRRTSFLLYALPPFTVLVVGFALLVAGPARPLLFARVLGGPTLGVGDAWSGRVQLVWRDADVDTPAAFTPLRVVWSSEGSSTQFRTTTDADGWAEVQLERPHGARSMEIAVYGGERGVLAARGAPVLAVERWRKAARRRSGRVDGSLEGGDGATRLEVRIPSGVLAVPFEELVLVQASRHGQPLRGARVEWTVQGLDVQNASPVFTDVDGMARLAVRPREHVVSLELRVRPAEEAESGRWFSYLPVVAGALRPRVDGADLVIESPIVRDTAWYAFVSEQGRGRGGSIALRPNGRGGAEGRVPLTESGVMAPPVVGRWLVVSGDADGRSPSTVGWPWADQGVTFDAWDAELLDGARFGERREEARRRRVRWTVGCYSVVAALLTAVLFVRRIRAAEHELERRLVDAGAPDAVSARGRLTGGLVVGTLCVLLGFLVVLLVSLARAS